MKAAHVTLMMIGVAAIVWAALRVRRRRALMNLPEVIARAHAAEVAKLDLAWWYLSFSGDAGFRGGAIVWAFGPTDAILEAHMRGINPGGSIAVVRLDKPPPESARFRLMTKDDLREYGELQVFHR